MKPIKTNQNQPQQTETKPKHFNKPFCTQKSAENLSTLVFGSKRTNDKPISNRMLKCDLF